MKTILTRIYLLLLALLALNGFPHLQDFAADFDRDFPDQVYSLYTANDLTEETLRNRMERNDYIVEVTTGTVLNENGDGREDRPDPYNYISYRHMPFETKPGDRIVTYLVYEIHSDYTDDIIARYDYPLN